MAVKLKLKRIGAKHKPFYRIVVADERWSGNTGLAIDTIGTYNPKANPKIIDINKEKAEEWLKKGAIPTDPVKRLLKTIAEK